MTLTVLNVAYPFAEVDREATGGAEQIVASLDRALVKAGHRSVVLACTGSVVEGELVSVDVPSDVLTPEVRAPALHHYHEVLERLVGLGDFQVVHLHGVDCAAYWPDRVAPLITLHLPVSWYAPALWSRPDVRLVFVSHAQRASSRLLAMRGSVIENGVDLDAFSPAPAGSDGDSYFLGLGRICPEKGFHLALRAAHTVGCDFILAGRLFPYPEHLQYFREQIVPLLDRRRLFVGPVRGAVKATLLARASALVVPSQVAETSSLVTMEALASGTPVIVSNEGALPSLVEPGVTGFVVDSLQELELALRHASKLDRRACRASAERRYDRRRMVARYLDLYRRLACSQPRAGAA